MEISKEKFIQLFQDECSRAVDVMDKDCFRSITPITEVIPNEEVSIGISKNPIWPADGTEPKKFIYSGRIVFYSWIVNSEYELTEQEYLELEDYFIKCEQERRIRHRKYLMELGEKRLALML
jgi:hypothetical protein